ncbi:ferric reduction oxidase 4-like [Chenopodium quinoa]|uniref:ferric reduction oxidase 4-like n=1 Tax=Chenopodium quinoa TaxID=63459 RepID=UPI000B78832E|nr:ferric reduction oxidase 4-like [Chenopodium quinoa]XP_021726717.1 ferric reduction oxidase 4-like [Chenopodium quinoa]
MEGLVKIGSPILISILHLKINLLNIQKKMNRLVLLKLICLLLFLGWMVVWIVLPMEFFKYDSTPKLSKMFNPSYIGGQGIYLFLLTFPMMLISVLGCIYLHIRNKTEASSKRSSTQQHLTSLRRPLLVLGPLGVVTSMELIFLIMGIALVSWQFGNYFYVSVKHPFMMSGQEHQKPWQLKFRSASLRIGYASNIAWAFVFFPVTRLSSILPLVGLTFESSIKYHVWIGQVVMITSALHSIGFIIYWAMVNQMSEMLEWTRDYVSNIAGEMSWVFLMVMWVTSFAYTRRRTFEVFFYTHQLYTLATFFYVIHIGVAWTMQIVPGIFLFTLDRYLRFLQSRSCARLILARILPGGTVELSFSKSPGVRYNVTSNLFVNVPKISKLQWHPFTVTSNDNMEPDKLSIVFKSGGSWTTKLFKELSSSSLDRLEVSVEGPYGPASTNFLKHESLVLISGGSGITPFIPIIREMIYQSNIQKGQVPRVQLICAFKHAAELTMLDLLLPAGNAVEDISKIQLEIHAYVTRDYQPPESDSQKLVQTKWFKPNPSDLPITSVLGPNGWLHLCFIIVSSFILFLVLLALVTQYHIYPIDQGTNRQYNFTIWVLWDLFLMCICIILISSVVFLLQKREITAEAKQIMNVEVPTPVTSPGSWLYGGLGGDRELESLPYQSLVQATKVHYGGRPDLKKILSESKGQDVGVMASGPRGMRHDVARICSCNAAKNLHFEYLSFNW